MNNMIECKKEETVLEFKNQGTISVDVGYLALTRRPC